MMRVVGWAASDIGKKRDHNEDSHLVDEKLRLFAVADGMGGHQGGDQASRIAIEVLREQIGSQHDLESLDEPDPGEVTRETPRAPSSPDAADEQLAATPALGIRLRDLMRWGAQPGPEPDDERGFDDITADGPTDPSIPLGPPPAAALLRAAARAAGRAIYDAAQMDLTLAGMGTTLTAALFHRDRAHLVHVGDSRALLIRDGEATQLTEDHSWIAEQVRAGVLSEGEARESKFRHIITRSVGFERDVDVDLIAVPVLPGDCILLCSDGMSNHVTAEEIGRIVRTTYYSKVPQLLVDLANDRGGDDNITVVLVYVGNHADD